MSKDTVTPSDEQEEENLEESPSPLLPKEREANQPAITSLFLRVPMKPKVKARIQVEAAERERIQVEAAERESSEKSNVGEEKEEAKAKKSKLRRAQLKVEFPGEEHIPLSKRASSQIKDKKKMVPGKLTM